jgi:hypothetical protein
MKKKFKIIDSAFAHCNYSNNPTPPIQESPWVEWERNVPLNNDETLFVTEMHILNPNVLRLKNKKIAWLLEPITYSPHPYSWVSKNYHYYTYVFSHNKEFLKSIPNGIWVPTGGCWVHEKDWSTEHEKTNLVSMMLSTKRQLEGHNLRHRVNESLSGIDVYGNAVKPIEYKITSLSNYKYQIVIENSRVGGYFTEKLIDCFVTGTVPIYWGDPLIGDYFDTDGMIIVNSFEEIKQALDDIKNIDYSKFNISKINNFNNAKEFILSENYFYKNYSNIL